MTTTPQSPTGQTAIDTDGPAVSPGRPKRSGSRRRGGLLPVAISALALIVSLGSTAVALQALDRANYARDFVLAGRVPQQPTVPAPQPPGPVPTTGAAAPDDPAVPTETAGPVDPTSTAAPELNPETRYTVKYEREGLELQWPSSCTGTRVDLDEPRVIVDRGDSVDIALSNCSTSTPYFQLEGGSQGASVTSPTATPQDCAERIQKGPILPDSRIPARQGLVLCVLTDFAAAQAAGDTRKMIRAEVKGVALNERISIEATAWIIP